MVGMAAEAAAKAQIQYQLTGQPKQYIKINNVWFCTPINIDKKTGVIRGIRTVFPRTSGAAR